MPSSGSGRKRLVNVSASRETMATSSYPLTTQNPPYLVL